MLELDKVYKIDALQGMKQLKDFSIDLIITDPPYGIGIAKKGFVGGEKLAKVKDYKPQKWDLKPIDKQYFDEMFRVSKNQIIFGGNYYIDYLYNTSCWIVWDKDNSANFADCELAWTSFNTATRKFKWRWNGMLQEHPNQKEKRYHPTQKPLSLMDWIVKTYSNEGELILDPFCGSGTTLVACKRLDRRFIGFDLNDEYIRVSNKRLYNVPFKLEDFQT